MSAPAVPPRPYSAQGYERQHIQQNPPPVPPLPPDLRQSQYESLPHFDRPLAAPRPHRLDPSIPQNMARNLDDQLDGGPPYQPPVDYRTGINYSPGFAMPAPARGPSPLPPPQGAGWSPWAPREQYTNPPPPQIPSMPYPGSSMATDLSFSSTQPAANPPQPQRSQSMYGPPPKAPSPPSSTAPSLTAPIPNLATLQSVVQTIQQPNHDPTVKMAWARDVLFLVDKQQNNSTSTDAPVGPVIISDPQLLALAQTAVSLVLQIASTNVSPLPLHVAEAIYLRATFASSGAYPDYVKRDLRTAFRDFETAAKSGYAAAWFRLGRDYENFNDVTHARDCFDRGVKLGVESCAYRMGMAHLMGQLGLPPNPSLALPLLHRAATLSTTDVPQPAYVYALLLLGEFTQLPTPLSPSAFAPFIPPSSSPTLEARKHLERAAYLNFAPAQYKLGHAYEFAQPPFPFDALLSVQYYSLASQQGEVEADMALSKWFLCGSGEGSEEEGGFEKDESLAWTFADKAARRGLPSAEFAMGYYAEVGVGGPKDVQAAVRWYTKAKEHGNADAAERLAALSQPSPQALSRHEHDAITENKLVRKRTQAKQRSDTQPRPTLPTSPYPPSQPQVQPHPNPHLEQGHPPRADGRQVVENIRRNSQGGYPAPGPNPQQQHMGRLSSVHEYGSPHPHHQNSLPPQQQPQQQQYNQSSPRPQGSPQQRPQSGLPGRQQPQQQQPQQQYPNTNRYTLTDSPVPTGMGQGGRKSPARPGLGRGHGRMPSNGPVANNETSTGGGTTPGLGGGVVIAPKPGKGPTTFAEMGFQGAKAEDKECIIM